MILFPQSLSYLSINLFLPLAQLTSGCSLKSLFRLVACSVVLYWREWAKRQICEIPYVPWHKKWDAFGAKLSANLQKVLKGWGCGGFELPFLLRETSLGHLAYDSLTLSGVRRLKVRTIKAKALLVLCHSWTTRKAQVWSVYTIGTVSLEQIASWSSLHTMRRVQWVTEKKRLFCW